MAFLLAYFDESGKFKDKRIISFCGFAASVENWDRFDIEWSYALRHNGLRKFKSSEVFRHRVRLSSKVSALGVQARVEVVKQFVQIIRQTVEIGIGSAVDAGAFHDLTSEEKRHIRDPHYLAFRLSLFELNDYVKVNPSDEVALICDDEELYSIECYKIYSRLRRTREDFKKRFVSISFADDSHFSQLQAADLLSSICRFEGARQFHGQAYDFEEVSQELKTVGRGDRMRQLSVRFLDSLNLKTVAKNTADQLRSQKKRQSGID